MPEKKYESPLQQFHNQKSGDFNPETGVLYDYPSDKLETAAQYKDSVEAMERVGEAGKLEQLIRSTLDRLDSLQLQPEFRADAMEQKLLGEKVKLAKNLLQEVLSSASDYIDTIKVMGEVKLDVDSEDFRERLQNSDEARRLKHDALLSDINIFNRFVHNNFGALPPEQLEKFTATEKAAGRPLPRVERVEWPKNVVLPEQLDIKDRRQVMDWAIALSGELDELRERL